jgi:hypothetical protein
VSNKKRVLQHFCHAAFAIRAGLRDNCLSKQHLIPASGVQARGKTLVNCHWPADE